MTPNGEHQKNCPGRSWPRIKILMLHHLCEYHNCASYSKVLSGFLGRSGVKFCAFLQSTCGSAPLGCTQMFCTCKQNISDETLRMLASVLLLLFGAERFERCPSAEAELEMGANKLRREQWRPLRGEQCTPGAPESRTGCTGLSRFLLHFL